MRSIGLVALGGAALLMAVGAQSTTLRALTLTELVFESDAIVRGVVEHERSQRHPRLGVIRIVRIAVSERLYGTVDDAVEVVLFGGEMDDVATMVAGEARLLPSSEMLLFLMRGDERHSHFRVVGMEQGAFHVLRDESNEPALVTRTLGLARLIDTTVEGPFGLARGQSSSCIPLEAMRRAIATLTARAAGRR